MMNRSQIAVSWVLCVRGVTPTAWKILMVLAHKVNNKLRDFDVWQRQAQLAEACDMKLSTLKRHLDELEEKGLLVRRKKMRKSGGFACCVYTLAVKASFDVMGQTYGTDFVAEEDLADQEEDDQALGQIELARSPTGELARSLTVELAIEPSNSEPSNPEQTPNGVAESTLAEAVQVEWNALAKRHRGISAIRKMDRKRARAITLRGAEFAGAGSTTLDVWRECLAKIERSPWLRGEKPGGDGRTFALDLTWATKPENFLKIMEGRYDDRSGNDDGLGPIGRILRRASERDDRAREQEAGRGGGEADYARTSTFPSYRSEGIGARLLPGLD